MVSWRECVLLFLLISVSMCAVAQTVERDQNLYAKPTKLSGVHLEVSVGLSASHFDKYYDTKPLHSFYSEVDLVIPLSHKINLKAGLAYQVIGSISTRDLPDGLATATRRLPYLSAQGMASYNLSRTENRIQFELQGGVFLSKKLDDETVNVIPNMPDNRFKSVESTIGFNGGIVMGSSVSVAIGQKHRIGVKFLYNQGVIDVRTPAAKRNTGPKSLFTQAFTVGSYLTI